MAQSMEKQRQMQLEMAMKQRQTQMAMQTALAKERFHYYSAFVGLLYSVLPIAAVKNRNPALLFPLVPVSFAWAFQYDMAYGDMMIRAQKDASRMIKEEPERFFMPQGNGMVSQKEYNQIVGLPENYKGK